MKRTFLSLAIGAAALASVNANAAPPVVVNGGSINFAGTIVNAACSVSPSSANQTVTLGQVRASTLGNDGDTSTVTGFNIVLEDCDTSISTTAEVAFSGVTESGKPQVLRVDSGLSGAARNVGIQILDSAGGNVTFNNNSWTPSMTLVDGRNVIPFQARYVAVGGPATAGTANAQATFKIQYQ